MHDETGRELQRIISTQAMPFCQKHGLMRQRRGHLDDLVGCGKIMTESVFGRRCIGRRQGAPAFTPGDGGNHFHCGDANDIDGAPCAGVQ